MRPTEESQLVLLVDDDVAITEGLAAGLERDGRTVITCNDVESAQLIVERMSPSHVVADVRLTGPFGYEGLDFIRHVRRRAPESRIILIVGDGTEALQFEASQRGAVAFPQNAVRCAGPRLDARSDFVLGVVESLPPRTQPGIAMHGN